MAEKMTPRKLQAQQMRRKIQKTALELFDKLLDEMEELTKDL